MTEDRSTEGSALPAVPPASDHEHPAGFRPTGCLVGLSNLKLPPLSKPEVCDVRELLRKAFCAFRHNETAKPSRITSIRLTRDSSAFTRRRMSKRFGRRPS